jgi:hypothetical protein
MRWLVGFTSALFADKNKDARGQSDEIDQEDSWPEGQTEPEKAVEDQIDREQNHADAFGFHDPDLLDRAPDCNPNLMWRCPGISLRSALLVPLGRVKR